ncbi:MAG TPA: hypothetical protein VM124_02090 [Candidatus Limnocylindrales bacterium]|nr:hypothetical protein [Candidatus Limnocylindrales bacterium]
MTQGSTVELSVSALDPVEASVRIMKGTLGQVQRLRGITQQSGMLALESTLGLPSYGGVPELDRVTYTTGRALVFATIVAAEGLAEAGSLDERTVNQVRKERHTVVTNELGSTVTMGKLRRVMPPVFSNRYKRQITGSEHVGLARSSFGIARRLANKSFPEMEALIKYATLGLSTRIQPFDPAKFTIAESSHGQALAFANPAEVDEVIEAEKERLKRSVQPPKPHSRCLGLGITDGTTNLVESAWGLMADIQEAQLAVRPRDRARYVAVSAVRRVLSRPHSG